MKNIFASSLVIVIVLGTNAWSCAAGLAPEKVPEVKRAEYPDRWVHVRNDLASDARLDHFGRVIARAAESGFNGVMWDAGVRGEGIDFDGWKGARLARLEKAKAICREKGMEIIPMVWSVGRAHALLKHDPTLAECQSVRGVPYRANGGKAEFEAGNAAVMKDIFGGPVTVNASGKRSRSVNIKVKPFRRYRLTAHAVQKGFKSTKGEGVNKVPVRNAFSIWATPQKAGQNLNTRETVVGVSVADGESDLVLEFLSLDFCEEMISVGVNYRSEAGEVTFTDMHVAEVGIRRPIVREGAPFVVRDAATGAIYEPGKDYVVPKSDASPPGPNDRDVTILLPQGSAIRSGASLVVEAYEPSRRRDVQAGACMANPALYAYFEKSAPVIYELFGRPKKWFLSMDEIRAGGMCGACKASGKDLAHLLADCLAHQRDAIRKVCPDATVYAWCDMYDPFVNAKSRKAGYAMCNGDFSFNEFIAPKDIVAVVWGGQESAPKSLEYFSSLGIPTLYATFYDVYSADHFRVRGAVPTANKVPGCRGLMYTTWVKNGKYDLLGAFGDFMKAYSNPMPAK